MKSSTDTLIQEQVNKNIKDEHRVIDNDIKINHNIKCEQKGQHNIKISNQDKT